MDIQKILYYFLNIHKIKINGGKNKMNNKDIYPIQAKYILCFWGENETLISLFEGTSLTEIYDITTLFQNSQELATKQFQLWSTTQFVIAKKEKKDSFTPTTNFTIQITSYPIFYQQDPRYPYIRNLLSYYEQHPTQDQDFPNWLFHRSLKELIQLEKIRIHNEKCFSQNKNFVKEKK